MSDTSKGGFEDSDQYNSSRRLRAINDARDEVREIRAAIMSPDVNITTQEKRRWLYSRVDAYLTELEPKLESWHRDHQEDEPGTYTQYYTGVQLGTVAIEPPDELREMVADDTTRVIGNTTLDTKSIQLTGLRDYIQASPPFFGEWSLHVDARHHPAETVTMTRQVEMPLELSHTAYRYANLFADDIGLDIKVSKDRQQTKIDQDLMQEVEQWRKQNTN